MQNKVLETYTRLLYIVQPNLLFAPVLQIISNHEVPLLIMQECMRHFSKKEKPLY